MKKPHAKGLLSITLIGLANLSFCEEVKPEFIQYHNRIIIFSPFHQGYERIKPKAYYVGIEAFLASGLNKGSDHNLLDAELRMGYNFFFNGRDHLTPFAGVGFVEDFFWHHHHLRHKPGIVYGAAGFLYNHEFNTIFNLGFNAKLLIGGPVGKKHYWGTPVIGTDVALPITFRFGHKRHWDYRIEPFNMYLHGPDAHQNYFGFRNIVGYRF